MSTVSIAPSLVQPVSSTLRQRANPLWRCLALYREMPDRFLLTAGLFVFVNLSLAWQQWLVGRAINAVQQGHAIVRLPDGLLDWHIARNWALALIGVALLRGFFQYLGGVMALVIGQELLYILRERILLQVQRLDLAYHWQHGMGEIVTRTTRDADKVRDALINFWRQVFEAALVLLAAVGLLSWYDFWLGLIQLLLTLTGIAIFVFQTEKLVTLDRAVGEAYDRVNQDLSEGVNGIRVIKSFGLEQARITIFSRHVEVFMQQAQAALAYASSHIPLPQVVVALGHAWILGYGAHLVEQGQLNVGELVASLLVANTLVFRIEGVGRVMQIFADARSSAGRIWELLDAEPTIQSGRHPLPEGPLGLRLVNVEVDAPGSTTPILREANFEIAPGEIVALVGVTGSGKSTPAGLLPRLLEADRGAVLLGSPWSGWQNIKTLDLNQVRRKVNVVPQESFLFSDTLAANLRVGQPLASDEDLKQALDLAAVTEVIENLPEGLQTKIGDRGITLSGGQRQRLSLARALLAKPAILILDDATSALDTLTEKRVLDNLRQLRDQHGHGVTVLLIASKLSTILLADRVALLAEGKIKAEGTHAVLVAENAEYRDLLGIDEVQHGQ